MIILGSSVGALLRYGAYQCIGGFYGVIVVNMLGSCLAGLLWAFSQHAGLSEAYRVLLMVGCLGAFTTFSAFSLESMALLQQGKWVWGIANILIQPVLGLLLCYIGFQLGAVLWRGV